MKKRFLLLFISIINFLSAQEKTLSGKLTGFQNGDKISFYDPEIMKTLDSTYMNNGSFKLKNSLHNIPKSIFILVSIGSEDLVFITFIAGENVEISGDKKDFKFNLNVKGSKFQKEKDILDEETKNYNIERDSLEKYFNESDTSKAYLAIQKIKFNRIREIDKITDEIRVKYIKEHINSFYALYTLTYYYKLFSKNEIQDLYNKLDKEHQESIYGKRVKTFLEVGKILEVGDVFYDFEAKGQDDKMHKLSEIKDKYILLDFNETYCGPCAASVSELKNLASTYKDNMQIVSFCADKPENIWKTGLNRDKPNWLSLWDGNGTKGATVVKYGSDGFPTFVLIDKAGKIVKIVEGFEKGIIEKMLKENIKL